MSILSSSWSAVCSFLIGVLLVADGVGEHIPRGHIYFAMEYSFLVEMLDLRIRPHTPPVRRHESELPSNQNNDAPVPPPAG